MNTSDFTITQDLALACQLADAAWAAIKPHFRSGTGVEGKAFTPGADFDPVTEGDKAAERAIRAILEAERPEHGVLGEEYPETPSQSGYKWLIDPIDGTRAFVAGLPVCTTLIALCAECEQARPWAHRRPPIWRDLLD